MELIDKLMNAVETSTPERLRSEIERILVVENLIKAAEKTPFEVAMVRLKEGVPTMPANFEFEIPQVIGADVWAQLDRGSKLAMGKHVKASQEAYGVKFSHTSKSNHAVYCRR